MYDKIDNLKTSPIIGKYYLVPCIIEEEYKNTEIINPIINHLHNDKENGQDYKHYHADYRFIDSCYEVSNKRYNLIDGINYNIVYKELKCIRLENLGITHSNFISKSRLYSKCISSKSKCPHKKYDLSQETAINGVITCPLHGLKFNNSTKQLINNE